MLAHSSRGSGRRDAVLLHGFLGAGRNLATLARRLAERRPDLRVTTFDLTGHGESPALPAGADLTTLAGDLVDACSALGLTRPDLIGHSLGGRVALAACLAAPERLGDITLLDIAPGPIPSHVTRADRADGKSTVEVLAAAPAEAASRADMRAVLLAAGLTPAIADWLLQNLVPDGGRYRWRFDRAALRALYPRLSEPDLWPALETGGPPERAFHCIRGGRSPYVSDADVARLRAAGATVDTLEAGHFIHLDAPDALLDRLAENGNGGPEGPPRQELPEG